MVLEMIPAVATAVPSENTVRTADLSTINDWQHLFMDPTTDGVSLTTENAGGVWTDKSVFYTLNDNVREFVCQV